jgi:hypothetical protein
MSLFSPIFDVELDEYTRHELYLSPRIELGGETFAHRLALVALRLESLYFSRLAEDKALIGEVGPPSILEVFNVPRRRYNGLFQGEEN